MPKACRSTDAAHRPTYIGYAPQLEDFILPQSEDVEKAVQELMNY